MHLQFGRTPGGRGAFQAEDGTTRLCQVERLLFREGGKVLPAAAARFLLKQVKNKPVDACDALTYRQDFASGDNVKLLELKAGCSGAHPSWCVFHPLPGKHERVYLHKGLV